MTFTADTATQATDTTAERYQLELTTAEAYCLRKTLGSGQTFTQCLNLDQDGRVWTSDSHRATAIDTDLDPNKAYPIRDGDQLLKALKSGNGGTITWHADHATAAGRQWNYAEIRLPDLGRVIEGASDPDYIASWHLNTGQTLNAKRVISAIVTHGKSCTDNPVVALKLIRSSSPKRHEGPRIISRNYDDHDTIDLSLPGTVQINDDAELEEDDTVTIYLNPRYLKDMLLQARKLKSSLTIDPHDPRSAIHWQTDSRIHGIIMPIRL